MKYTDFKLYDKSYKIDQVDVNRYTYGNRIAISLYNYTDGAITTATVNIKDANLADDEIIVDTNNNTSSIINWLYENNIIDNEEPRGYVSSGWCTYPVYKLALDFYIKNK